MVRDIGVRAVGVLMIAVVWDVGRVVSDQLLGNSMSIVR